CKCNVFPARIINWQFEEGNVCRYYHVIGRRQIDFHFPKSVVNRFEKPRNLAAPVTSQNSERRKPTVMESSPPSPAVEPVNFGRSLIVPSVQELAKECNEKLPPRYERPQIEPLVVSGDLDWTVPVIDLQKLASGDESSMDSDSELGNLHSACKDWGFFQVVNHGVCRTLLEELRVEVENLFQLPYEEKKRKQLWQQPHNHEGFGQLFVVSEEQKLDWNDMFYITTLPRHIRQNELFDKLPHKCRETVEAYSMEMRKLALKILSHMSRALGMDVNEMEDLFTNGVQSIRMNYYPPTILYQLNETEGLQIRKDGKWVPIKPLPDAFVVNVGDIMEIVSNGVYRSIEHRAAVNSTRERLSVATFYSCKLDCTLGPARSLVGPRNPPAFQQVPVEDYFKEFFARRLNGKSYLEFMRINVDK
ncbi:unnamed protein product, partial [Linum tenue]